MAINDIFQATIGMVVAGEKCVNVFHFKQLNPDGANPPDFELCSLLNTGYVPVWQAASSNDATIQTIRARRVSPTLGGFNLFSVGSAGTVAQDTLPPNSAVCLSLYSSTLTKRGRGRCYLPGVPDTHNQDGLIPETVKSLYNDIGTWLITPFSGAGTTQFECGVWSASGGVFHSFEYYMLRSWIHTIRSRRVTA